MSGGGGAMVNDSPWREISWASNPTVREAAKQDDETTDTAPSDPPPSLSELVKGRAGNSNFGRAGLSAAASGCTPLHVGGSGPASPPTWLAGAWRPTCAGVDSRAPSRSWQVTWTWRPESGGRGMGARIPASVAYAAYPLGPAAGTSCAVAFVAASPVL